MTKFTKAFTSLRGVACIAVILCHDNEQYEKDNASLSELGYIGVIFFFVLSAYLLTKNILAEILPAKNEPPKSVLNMVLVRYCIRRIFRVYPAFLASIGIGYAVYKSYENEMVHDPSYIYWAANTIILRVARNHFWTIRIEMAFYFIMLPAFAIAASIFLTIDYKWFKNSKIKTFPIFLLMVTGEAIHILVRVGYVKNYYYYNDYLDVHFPVFWFGCLGGVASHYLKPYNLKLDNKKKIIMYEILSYIVILRIYFGCPAIARKYFGVTDKPWWLSLSFLAPTFPIFMLILEKGGTQCSVGRFLSIPALVSIGTWSYSTYLMHILMMKVVQKLGPVNGFDGTFEILVVCNIAGFVLYKFIEDPFFRLSRPLIKLIDKYVKRFINRNKKKLAEEYKEEKITSPSTPTVNLDVNNEIPQPLADDKVNKD